MAVLHLFIPDRALREALVEQLASAQLGEIATTVDFATALKSEDTAAILLDEVIADKKILKILTDMNVQGKQKRIFTLGDAPRDWNLGLITESFSKPLRLGHILSRLQFYLHAAPRLNNPPVVFGPYRFEPQNRQLVTQENGAVIRLTEKETALLEQLSQSNTAVARDILLANIWGYGDQIDTHTLETHIYQLRRKLDPQGTGANWLINEQGAYRLNRAGQ